MKTAAAYIRVSTDDQVELSPGSQLKKIREYASKNGYIVPDEYVYKDEGISGRNASKRPEFNRMIGTAKTKPKPFDAILLWKFSRFARNREDSIVYKSMLRKQCGIDVISISESLGDDKMSILIEALIEAMDEYYSINLAEEVRRGMMEKISRGGLVSSAPIGYKVVNGELQIDESTADIVKYIYNSYLAGNTMLGIATDLNEKGVRTKTGGAFENRVIKYILQNPTYIGKHRWCPNGSQGSKTHYKNKSETLIYNGQHKPLISEDDFKKVQQRLSLNKSYARETSKHENALRGLVKCHSCGSTMSLMVNKGIKYLQCTGYTHGKCKISHSVKYDYVYNSVINSLQNIDIVHISKHIIQNDNQSQNKEINKQIEKEKLKLTRCKEAYQAGVDTLSEYRENKERIEIRIAELTSSIKQYDVIKQAKIIRKNILTFMPKLLGDDVSLSDKNAILKSIIDKVIYDNTTKRLHLFFCSVQ